MASPSPIERRGAVVRWRLLALAVALLGSLAYLNTLGNDFVLDDRDIVVENPLIRSLRNGDRIFSTNYWEGAGAEGARADPGLYRPLTVLSFALDYRLWKLNPAGYHAVNIVTHVLTAMLVLQLAASLLGAPIAAAITAAIFAVHPVHTEAVASVVGRAEILATMFFMSALVIAVRRSASDPKVAELPTVGRSIAAATCYLLAVFSKESAATFPLVLLLHDWLYRNDLLRDRGRAVRALAIRYGALLGAAAVYVVLRHAAVTRAANTWAGFAGVSSESRILTAIKVIAEYLGLLVFPKTLAADYWTGEVPIAHSLAEVGMLVASAVLLAAIATLVWQRRERVFVFAVGMFAITVLPMSNLLFPIGVAKAERILYLPSVGFCLFVGWAVVRLSRAAIPRWVVPAGAAATVLLFGARTVHRNADWHDQLTLALATLNASPSSPLMNDIAGVELARRNDIGRALPFFSEAVKQEPQVPLYHVHLGAAYYAHGRLDEAADQLKTAMRSPLQDAEPDARNTLALVYLAERNLAAAAVQLRASLKLNSQQPGAHSNLGMVYLEEGNLDAAMDEFTTAERLNPASPEIHNNIGAVHRERGELDAAVTEFREAIRLNPGFENAKHNLADIERHIGPPR